MPSIFDPEISDPSARVGRNQALMDDRVQRLERQSSLSYRQVGLDPVYVNGWRSYAGGGNDYAPVYFYRDIGGRVYLDGLADKNGGNFVAAETIFTLPDGYRPDRNLIFVVESAGNGGASIGTCQVRVDKTGVVKIGDRGGPASPVTWVSFAGINFRVS